MKELFVDKPDQLHHLCEDLGRYDIIGLDTEFLREKTYYAQLCLIQIACEDFIACVDPLALPDLQPLLHILYAPHITKVMHSGRQDLELFYDMAGKVPAPVFDTQIAATLLGYGDQIGYAALVEKMLGVKLAKTHTRTDWSRRPLDFGQMEYAVDDVRYLLEVYRRQHNALERAGRLEWLKEDFNALCDIDLYRQPEQELWRKVRGVKTLKGAQLAVLQLLTQWREGLAKAQNRPRRWVVRDDVLIELARRKPETEAALANIQGFDGHLIKHAQTILSLIRQAKAVPPEQRPQLGRHWRLTPQQEAQVDLLMAVVRIRAEDNQVTPSVLASRKELECLVQQKPHCAVTTGWRAELVGNELRAILKGQRSLRFDHGRLSVQ